jgi:hypothetical protein
MEQTLAPGPVWGDPQGARHRNEADSSGVSWGAILGGAVVTAALSLILLSLGAGLGLSAVSPWSGVGASSTVIGTAAILWLILMQVISGGLGGYLAGRLRTKWAGIHNDEVYFRDTAHGFLAWGLALVITAAFLASAATVMVGAAASSAGDGSGKAAAGSQLDPDAYYVDMLFRAPTQPTAPGFDVVRSEVGRVFAKAMAQREMSADDKSYVAKTIAGRTGLSEATAQTRLSDVFASAQQAADAARKAIAHTLLWIFAALLIGAFCASYAATIGGRQRDDVVLI